MRSFGLISYQNGPRIKRSGFFVGLFVGFFQLAKNKISGISIRGKPKKNIGCKINKNETSWVRIFFDKIGYTSIGVITLAKIPENVSPFALWPQCGKIEYHQLNCRGNIEMQ